LNFWLSTIPSVYTGLYNLIYVSIVEKSQIKYFSHLLSNLLHCYLSWYICKKFIIRWNLSGHDVAPSVSELWRFCHFHLERIPKYEALFNFAHSVLSIHNNLYIACFWQVHLIHFLSLFNILLRSCLPHWLLQMKVLLIMWWVTTGLCLLPIFLYNNGANTCSCFLPSLSTLPLHFIFRWDSRAHH
jgi:hypothetical protein